MTQTDKDKLTELQNIRTALDQIAQEYCSNYDELQTIANISARLWLRHIKPLLDKKTQTDKDKLTELQNIRTALDQIAQDYCSNYDELQTIANISARLWLRHIKPLLDKK